MYRYIYNLTFIFQEIDSCKTRKVIDKCEKIFLLLLHYALEILSKHKHHYVQVVEGWCKQKILIEIFFYGLLILFLPITQKSDETVLLIFYTINYVFRLIKVSLVIIFGF